VTWRWFSLEQVNSIEGPEWKAWNRPPGHRSRSLLAFSAGEAARRQGAEVFERFHLTLLRARHEQKLSLQERETIFHAARETGLDLPRLERDMEDPTILHPLASDHEEAAGLGVFGTPTIFFESGLSVYLKMRPQPPDEEALDFFHALMSTMANRPYVYELKSPRQPE
jgi:hypothetical protein